MTALQDLVLAGRLEKFTPQPDRVICYWWSGGPLRFALPMRARYAMRAVTAPMKVYDYYNPANALSQAPLAISVVR
ncbi:MAG: hypothetical protein ACKV2V_16350 [Blastocatellia bacterium]